MQIQIHITANSPEEARAVIAALGQAAPVNGIDAGVNSGITEMPQGQPPVQPAMHAPVNPCHPMQQPCAPCDVAPAMATPQPPIQPVVPPQAAADAYAARQQEFQANMAAVQASNGYPGYQPPVAPAPQAPGPMPAQAPTYTLEQLRAAGGQLMQAGKMAQLQAMLPKYGVVALTDLAKEHYGAVAAEMRAMGAAI
jgi:hypothetical protein